MFGTLIQVAIGGALGAVARHAAGALALRALGPGFPWATLGVNVLGSFLIGVLYVVLIQSGNRMAPLVVTGFLGGFTTFSAFSLDALALFERGQGVAAGAYVLASVVLSLAGVVLGVALARSLA